MKKNELTSKLDELIRANCERKETLEKLIEKINKKKHSSKKYINEK